MKIRKFLQSLTVCLNKALSFFNKKIINQSRIFDSDLETKAQRGTGVNYLEFIKSLEDSHKEIHDLKLQFPSDLHQYLIKNEFKSHPKNKSIPIEIPTTEKNLTIKSLVYPKTIQIDIGCSSEPITCDSSGILRFISILNRIKDVLRKTADEAATIPEITKWIITHRHVGMDGKIEYSAEAFYIAVEDLNGNFTRIYSKLMPDGRKYVRIEVIDTAKRMIPDEIEKFGGYLNVR